MFNPTKYLEICHNTNVGKEIFEVLINKGFKLSDPNVEDSNILPIVDSLSSA